ncbi:EamA family transporter [Saccharibacillus sp. JS10]|uniref:DMT family transporter n=1 Tax=Saccharibacillus sp. JS10 TaxID=2950552 RepID=UPI00210B1B3D|nr:DMT family transporter [Saccharibacillus sp. JS10]
MWFVFAVAAAACFGVRGILYQWTSQRPVDRNLLFVGVYLSGILVSLLLNIQAKQPWNHGVGLGVLMGVFSFAANASIYRGYEVGRASVVAFFSALSPLVVVLVAFWLWNEAPNGVQGIGFGIVVLALILVRYGQDFRSGSLRGWNWGLIAMLLYSFTDLSSKQSVLIGASMLPVLTMMFATGTVLFFLMYISSRISKKNSRPASPPAWKARRTLTWGMTVGLTNIAGMILMLHALQEGVTGIVSAITAMSVIIVILYARFYLKETWSRREAFGILLAFAGIVVLRLAS